MYVILFVEIDDDSLRRSLLEFPVSLGSDVAMEEVNKIVAETGGTFGRVGASRESEDFKWPFGDPLTEKMGRRFVVPSAKTAEELSSEKISLNSKFEKLVDVICYQSFYLC